MTAALLLGARPLSDIPTDPPPDLALGRLDMEGHTILYGDGGAGKGVIASHWAGLLGMPVLILDYEDHPGEWARRVRALGGDGGRIHHVSPMTSTWGGTRGPIWEQRDDIRDLCDELGVGYVVIDSIIPACGATDALKPEAPAQYATALAYVGRPALSLAHVTKEGDGRYPFGSAFWHHLARTTWSATKVGGAGHRVLLRHRKHNNHASQGKYLVTVEWDDDGLPRQVIEEGYSQSLAKELAVLLSEPDAADGLTVAQLVDRLNADLEDDEPRVKPDSVRTALRRGIPQRFTVAGKDQEARWSNA